MSEEIIDKKLETNLISLAFCKVLAEMEDPKKDKSAHNHKYADLPQVLKLIREIATKHGIYWLQNLVPSEPGSITLRLQIRHTSGQFFEPTEFTMPANDGRIVQQEQAKSVTYARRYQLQTAFGMSAEEDNDHNHEPPQGKPKIPKIDAKGVSTKSDDTPKTDLQKSILEQLAKK